MQGMHDVCAHHDLRREAVEQEQSIMMMLPEPTEVIPTRKPASRPMNDIPTNDFMVGLRRCHVFLDPALEEQEGRNANQQDADGSGDEVIDAVAVDVSQVNQEAYAQNRSRNAADDQRQDHLAPDRALSQWTILAPILVTKLKRASDPTARIEARANRKSGWAAADTPPPTPVIPIRVPTTKPIRIFDQHIVIRSVRDSTALDRLCSR